MGFTRTITSVAGVEYTSAYHKIATFRIDWRTKECLFSFEVYADKASRDAGDRPLRELGLLPGLRFMALSTEFDTWFKPAVLDPVDKNPIKQAYLYAKDKLNDPSIVDVDPDE